MVMKNKRGSITVEAVIVVSVMILVCASLFQLLTLFPEEDIKVQTVYDICNKLDTVYYIYHKVGIFDSTYESGYQALDDLIEQTRKFSDETTAEYILEETLSNLLAHEDMVLSSFELKDDRISGQIGYSRSIVFGYTWDMAIKFDKTMWLFGDNKSIYPNKSLADLLHTRDDHEKNLLVYQTKTGGKYHMAGCFYLRRSTTDKPNIKSMSLYEAKRIKHLTPCKRCIGGE